MTFVRNVFSNWKLSFYAGKFTFTSTNESDVMKLLLKLDNRSASGYRGIPCKVLKYCAAELSEPLSDLFNLCIFKQVIPGEWKVAMVRPLYKGKGARDELDNYRPISNLNPLSKIFESILA